MKNNRSIRTICALFAGILLLSACAEPEKKPMETTPDTSEESVAEETELTRANTPDTLPKDLRFAGETVIFHVRGDSNCVDEFLSEETSGDPVRDEIYLRNSSLGERLNVKIDVAVGNTWQEYDKTVSSIRASIQAADGAYDVIAGWSARIPGLSLEGLFLDIQTVPYVNLSMPWWNQSLRSELTVANRLFFATGDITQSIIQNMYVYTFNQKVALDEQIEDPYAVVNAGNWTLDYVRKQTNDMANDLNGNGKTDKEDFFGLVTYQANGMDNYMQSARVSLMRRDEEGMPVLEVDKERLTGLVEKVYDLCFENPGCYVLDAGAYDDAFAAFKENRALYTTMTMSQVRSALADMEADFGILPYPKLDTVQSEYGTRVQDGLVLCAVPIDCKKVDVAGAVMEAVAAENYRKVTPALYDVTMKRKYSRDPESAAMIDLIQQSVLLNFESIYNESIGKPWFLMRDLMNAKSKNFASYWAKQEKVVSKLLDKAVEKIREVEQ